jgi:hypothetical protein
MITQLLSLPFEKIRSVQSKIYLKGNEWKDFADTLQHWLHHQPLLFPDCAEPIETPLYQWKELLKPLVPSTPEQKWAYFRFKENELISLQRQLDDIALRLSEDQVTYLTQL